MTDEPAFLTVGTEVSAKFKGAFCEAKIKKIQKCVKCKGNYLQVGNTVKAQNPETLQHSDAKILKIMDSSLYTVEFDDGDIRTLRRNLICLKGQKHFQESQTLDKLPLTNPELFGTPVVTKKSSSSNVKNSSSSDNTNSTTSKNNANHHTSSSTKSNPPQKSKNSHAAPNIRSSISSSLSTQRRHLEKNSLPLPSKNGSNTASTSKTLNSTTKISAAKLASNSEASSSNKSSKAPISIPKKDKDFTKHSTKGVSSRHSTPSDTEPKVSEGEGGADDDNISEEDEDEDDEEEETQEEKDHFVARLYKFMDDRGTPLNKLPSIGSTDLNLHKLFKTVSNMGYYNKVTNNDKWMEVCRAIGVFKQCDWPRSMVVKRVQASYKKYLLSFEDFSRKLGCCLFATESSGGGGGSHDTHSTNSSTTGYVPSGRSLIREKRYSTAKNSSSSFSSATKIPSIPAPLPTSSGSGLGFKDVRPTSSSISAIPGPTGATKVVTTPTTSTNPSRGSVATLPHSSDLPSVGVSHKDGSSSHPRSSVAIANAGATGMNRGSKKGTEKLEKVNTTTTDSSDIPSPHSFSGNINKAGVGDGSASAVHKPSPVTSLAKRHPSGDLKDVKGRSDTKHKVLAQHRSALPNVKDSTNNRSKMSKRDRSPQDQSVQRSGKIVSKEMAKEGPERRKLPTANQQVTSNQKSFDQAITVMDEISKVAPSPYHDRRRPIKQEHNDLEVKKDTESSIQGNRSKEKYSPTKCHPLSPPSVAVKAEPVATEGAEKIKSPLTLHPSKPIKSPSSIKVENGVKPCPDIKFEFGPQTCPKLTKHGSGDLLLLNAQDFGKLEEKAAMLIYEFAPEKLGGHDMSRTDIDRSDGSPDKVPTITDGIKSEADHPSLFEGLATSPPSNRYDKVIQSTPTTIQSPKKSANISSPPPPLPQIVKNEAGAAPVPPPVPNNRTSRRLEAKKRRTDTSVRPSPDSDEENNGVDNVTNEAHKPSTTTPEIGEEISKHLKIKDGSPEAGINKVKTTDSSLKSAASSVFLGVSKPEGEDNRDAKSLSPTTASTEKIFDKNTPSEKRIKKEVDVDTDDIQLCDIKPARCLVVEDNTGPLPITSSILKPPTLTLNALKEQARPGTPVVLPSLAPISRSSPVTEIMHGRSTPKPQVRNVHVDIVEDSEETILVERESENGFTADDESDEGSKETQRSTWDPLSLGSDMLDKGSLINPPTSPSIKFQDLFDKSSGTDMKTWWTTGKGQQTMTSDFGTKSPSLMFQSVKEEPGSSAYSMESNVTKTITCPTFVSLQPSPNHSTSCQVTEMEKIISQDDSEKEKVNISPKLSNDGQTDVLFRRKITSHIEIQTNYVCPYDFTLIDNDIPLESRISRTKSSIGNLKKVYQRHKTRVSEIDKILKNIQKLEENGATPQEIKEYYSNVKDNINSDASSESSGEN